MKYIIVLLGLIITTFYGFQLLSENNFNYTYTIVDLKTSSQHKSHSKPQYFLGYFFNGHGFIDETSDYLDVMSSKANKYSKVWDNNSSKSLKKESGNYGEYIVFTRLIDAFKGDTKYNIGDAAYISTLFGTYKSYLKGYVLLTLGSGYKLYDYFELEGLKKYKISEDKNIIILSTESGMSGINYTESDQTVIINYLKSLRSKLVFLKNNSENNKFIAYNEEIDVFSGAIAQSDDIYIGSYVYRYENGIYANAVYVFDKNANILKTFKNFQSPSKSELKKSFVNKYSEYYKIIGTVDINGDGFNEALLKKGYYEGGMYELWGYVNNKFVKITSGLANGL